MSFVLTCVVFSSEQRDDSRGSMAHPDNPERSERHARTHFFHRAAIRGNCVSGARDDAIARVICPTRVRDRSPSAARFNRPPTSITPSTPRAIESFLSAPALRAFSRLRDHHRCSYTIETMSVRRRPRGGSFAPFGINKIKHLLSF